MIKRRLEETVKRALQNNASVALMGPRQVGKTTIALDLTESLPSIYLDLENRTDLDKVKDIHVFHDANRDKLIVLDEVQKLPEIFAELRGIIDRERRKNNRNSLFLFLGSASIDLLKQSSESLAGRISYMELHPIDVLEYTAGEQNKINNLWLRGGFPESLLADSDHLSGEWRNNFIKTYLERDIPQLGPRIPAATLERFWTMLAHHQGSVFNASHLARNLDISSVTVGRYLDLMTDLLLVRRLQPWIYNTSKRLIKSPKVYVRDSGITHSLLNIEDFNSLLGHPVIGTSWEGFVIENIISVIPPNLARPYYYGSPGGAEIDLLIEFNGGAKWAIEIKRSASPKLSKGFYVACEDLKPSRKFVVYSGKDTFPMGDGVTAISLFDLMKEVLNR